MVHFVINFDRPDCKYRPGETVNCLVRLSLSSPAKFRSIYARLRGEANVKWTESRTVTRNGKSHTEHTTYSSHDSFFKYYQTLAGAQGAGSDTTLPAGTHEYQVSYTLPRRLPQNFEGDHGHIRYDMKVHMDVAWGFDNKQSVSFYIVPHLDLNEFPHLREPVHAEASKRFGCCCWESDPLHTFNVLPRKGFVPGDRVSYSLELNNDSDVSVYEAEVKLVENVIFHAHSPRHKTRNSKRTLWEFHFRTPSSESLVLPLQKKVFSTELLFNPDMATYKFFDACGNITVEYYIKSEAKVSGCHSNLDNHTTITIGTVPFYDSGLPTTMLPHVPLAPMAPMIDLPVYPLPSAPADLASAPPGSVTEQPLPSYHDAVYKQGPGLNLGWAVGTSNSEETPPPTFDEIEKGKI